MWGCYMWLFAWFAVVVGIPKILKEGDKCKLENRKKGICRRFTDCPPAIRDLDDLQQWPLQCTIEDNDPVVCCDESRMTTTTTTTPTTSTTTTRRPISGYGRKSKSKCKEYSTWIDPPILYPGSKKETGVCGVVVEQTIVGGTNATNLEFPHMVHLGYGEGSSLTYQCGASLISDQFLLTAAHCLRARDGTNLTVARLGTGKRESQKIIKITERIPHPKYEPPKRYNDIALLKLETPLSEFTDYMRPACLETEKDLNATDALASGWGLTSYLGEGSDQLLKVSLPLMNHTQCIKTYRPDFYLERGVDDSSMVCAGGYDLNKDTCNGDSGGPLQLIKSDPSCMYSIVGITSFGKHCGIAPGVYTRVSNYIPWIESIVWPNRPTG